MGGEPPICAAYPVAASCILDPAPPCRSPGRPVCGDMFPYTLTLLPLAAFLAFPLSSMAVEAEGVTEDKTSKHTLKPYDRKADTAPADSAEAAKKGFRRAKIPAGFKADLWASEPLLANPVAFSFDGQGRMYVAETHRYRTSVLDIRHYMFMLEDDLANRNQADWERSIKKNFPDDWQKLGVESEVVRLVEDTNGDGKADKSGVYADGFNSILDGIASGVLARPDGVWLTNIPGLYKLTGQGADGKAEKKEEVFRGFGVRFNYTGHDLHGLIKGPDGRLYFSIGDRGASVKTKEGTMLEVPDEGAIFRCEEDGSHLELVMRGLRNPQELAFDDYGNLFTCDNDSDQGDRERLVYVVEGGDAGWRIGYQHCPQPAERNPWLAEHMWEPRDPAKNQPAYILSPVANLPDGPGGLVHYPGTGLPEKYNGCFFLACYKGTSATSQVAVFKPVPDGAGFKLEMLETFIPGCQATDVDFGPDSRMYVSFWDEGWERTAQGRIMKVEHEEARKAQAAQIAEVQKLLGEGMKGRSEDELIKLLNHRDQRVRLEAQWELGMLVGEGDGSRGLLRRLEAAIAKEGPRIQRLHMIWALSRCYRYYWRGGHETMTGNDEAPTLLNDADAVVKAAWIKMIADAGPRFDERLSKHFTERLSDASSDARRALAQCLGRCGTAGVAVPALLDLARREQDKSQEMRHVIAHALAQLMRRSDEARTAVKEAETNEMGRIKDSSPGVRMALLQANRLCGEPLWLYIAPGAPNMPQGEDLRLVTEAIRLIDSGSNSNDLGLLAGWMRMWSELSEGLFGNPMNSIRHLNACLRRGREDDAVKLVDFASGGRHQESLRAEAFHMLAMWATPPQRDRLSGLYHPLPARPAQPAVDALIKQRSRLFMGDPVVAAAALDAVRSLKATALDKEVAALAMKLDGDAAVRSRALHVLSDLQSPQLPATLQKAIADPSSTVRIAAAGLLGKTDPAAAAKGLEAALGQGTAEDAREAFTELAALTGPDADRILAEQLIALTAGKVPAIARLELLEAAKKREAPAVKAALAAYEASLPKDDLLAKYAVSLEGGDAANGKRLFKEHPVAACARCHQVDKSGGEAGPALDGIASRKDRRYLLESIVNPNAVIADTFRMLVCTMKDGSIQAGVIQSETAATLTLQQPGDQPFTLNTADIAKREPVPSGMLPGLGELLTPRELRDLVEYCASLKAVP